MAEQFEKELKGFLKNLIKVFPGDRDMKMLSSTLNIALMDDYENKVLIGFYEFLSPFDSYIQERDERFFYECNTPVQELQLFNKLNTYWERLDDDNKKVVWDYLQVLYYLSRNFCVKA